MDSNLDIVFLGGLFPKETENEVYSKSIGTVQSSANAFQWNIVEGLDKCNTTPVKIINSLFIGSYPKRYKDIVIKTHRFNHCKNSSDINVGFINIFVIKHLVKYWKLKSHLKRWVRSGNRNKVILGYTLNYSFVKCLKYIKRLDPKVKTCIIIPDLPEYSNLQSKVSILYRFLKGTEIKFIRKSMPYIDNYVLVTEKMAQFLKIDKSYTVIEGISTDLFNDIVIDKNEDNVKTILYTGTLNKKFGVLDLVEAFNTIDNKDYRLVLCGSGDSEELLMHYAKLDNRIIFKGQLKREDVLKLQKQATVLINPRKNNEQYTKYSFPSKIIEYLSSGTPTIAYKLDGIPDEYDDYIYYINGDKPRDIAAKIEDICEKSQKERDEFGEKARKFVIENKSNKIQAEKIIKSIGF